jgi:carbon monoxide dehydrogenase subunit G
VIQKISPASVKAEIKVKMGAMAMVYTGTVDITEQNAASHRAVMAVKAQEKGGQGHANATVEFSLNNGGGNIHTSAQITGKAASMGEGAIIGVLDALIKDFTGKLTNM